MTIALVRRFIIMTPKPSLKRLEGQLGKSCYPDNGEDGICSIADFDVYFDDEVTCFSTGIL